MHKGGVAIPEQYLHRFIPRQQVLLNRMSLDLNSYIKSSKNYKYDQIKVMACSSLLKAALRRYNSHTSYIT